MMSLGVSLIPVQSDDARNTASIMASGIPPEFNQTLPSTINVTKGVMATFDITVFDIDNDSVHVEWSWGDGSPNATNDTPPAFDAQPVSQTHTWDPYVEQGSGDFNISLPELNVTIDDGNGNFVTISRPVVVYVPMNAPPTVDILGPSAAVDPLDNVTIYANASDPEGEPLTWTFVFNDTQNDFLTMVSYTGSTAPGELVWNNISYAFQIEGQYTVTVNVSDALPPNQTFPHNVSAMTTVFAVWNSAPVTSSEIAASPSAAVLDPVTKSAYVNYSVEVSDIDGDVVTATWTFGDGGPGAANVSGGTTALYTFVQMRKYTAGGIFNVSVVVSDGRLNHTVTLYRIMIVNSPPKFNQTFPGYGPKFLLVTKGVPATLNVTVYDADNDPIHVEWSWGDGSANSTNDTAPAFTARTASQIHTWDPIVEQGWEGTITMGTLNCTIYDANGSEATATRTVQVKVVNWSPNYAMEAPGIVDPMDNVNIIANATEPEGEPLTWTFVFNDTVSDFLTLVYHTPATAPNELVWQNVSYTFNMSGTFRVTMYVSDAVFPNQTGAHNVSMDVTITSQWNWMPSTSSEVQVDNQSPILNSTIGYLLVRYWVDAYDIDGDVLTATWDFGDGSPGAVNVSAGGPLVSYRFNQTVNYTHSGIFNISVVLTDGRANHTIYLFKIMRISSTNKAPSVVDLNFTYPTHDDFALPNETVYARYTFYDEEHDTIQVIVDWGDGTVEYFNVTESEYNESDEASLTIAHSYNITGSITVVFFYTDNQIGFGDHFLYQNLSIEVKIPQVFPPKNWSWWDYTSLGLVLMIPVLIAIRFFMVAARRKRLEKTGLSLEEWKLIKSEQLDQQEKDQKGS